MAEGLVRGEGFAVDASLIAADANSQRSVAQRTTGTQRNSRTKVSRAVTQYLAVLDDAAFGGASPATPKFISPIRSGGAMDGGEEGAGVLRLCRQII